LIEPHTSLGLPDREFVEIAAGQIAGLQGASFAWGSSRRVEVPIVGAGPLGMVDMNEEVIVAARGGDEWAWTVIYRALAPPVLGYLRSRGAVEPEDLLGEVFLQVVRDLPNFDGTGRDFRAWVFVVAHHRMLDDWRHRARRPVQLLAGFADGEDRAGDVEDEAMHAISTDRVRTILARLSPDQRDVLLLRILGGLTIDEIARTLDKQPGAVKALQRRGLAAIEREHSQTGVPL
jgi:RNA polymerase sigma-70 factor (ECF subfamily)